MAEKVTTMVIRVDLGCEKCRKKIKKVLCKIPQIRNQIYDEKSNTVIITVVCCSPEKVRDEIRCKAGEIILDIQIVAPKPPPKEPQEPKKKPPEPEEQQKPPKNQKKGKPKPEYDPCMPQPMPCCRECYEGRGWGPCYRDPCMPPPCNDPCYGRPVYGSWGGCGRIHVSGCSDYVCEENPTAACTIM